MELRLEDLPTTMTARINYDLKPDLREPLPIDTTRVISELIAGFPLLFPGQTPELYRTNPGKSDEGIYISNLNRSVEFRKIGLADDQTKYVNEWLTGAAYHYKRDAEDAAREVAEHFEGKG